MNDKTIQINIRSVYGAAKAYPVCDAAQRFATLAGSKTLTLGALREIAALGYAIFNVGNGATNCIDPHALRDLANVI